MIFQMLLIILNNYNEKSSKVKVSLVQEENEINKTNENNKSNSPSFNILNKKGKSNRIDNSTENNNSANIIQESGSFGNYQFSNFLSKEDISKENQENEIKRQKTKKGEKKNKNFSNLKNLDELSKKNIKKVISFKFNPYENQKSKDNDTSSSENTSSIILSSSSCLWIKCLIRSSSPLSPFAFEYGHSSKYLIISGNQSSFPLSSDLSFRITSRFPLTSSVLR